MRSGLLWPVAGAASIGVHAGGAAILLAAVAPQPESQQDTPAARMDLSTYQVERSAAEPAEASGDAAPEREAEGTALSGGEVPRARAEPQPVTGVAAEEVSGAAASISATAPEVARSEALASEGAPLPGTDPAGAALTALEAPSAVVPSVSVAGARAESIAAAPQALALSEASPQPIASGSIPESAVALVPSDLPGAHVLSSDPSIPTAEPVEVGAVSSAAPAAPEPSDALLPAAFRPEVAGVAPAVGTDLTSMAPDTDPVAPTAPSAEAQVAALAWSGGAGDEVDPLSLAAIQSFMRPGDIPDADAVRDGIGGLLQAVPCARLQSVFDPSTGALELRGHVPEEGLRAPVIEALQAQVGAAIPVRDNVRILPRPQCGALAGIAAVGLPQSTEQDTNPRVVGEGAHAKVYSFRAGERLEFDLQGPDYPAYFYIDYFDADGAVLHLQPNEFVPLEGVGLKEVLRIGADRVDKPSLNITVAPPFGQEIMVAFAASEPLFDALRPIQEPAGPYLDDLKSAVEAARMDHPDFKGEWVYFFVETRAR